MSGPISPTLAASPPSQRHQAAAIFVLLAFCFSMCQFLRSALAVIAPDMMRESSLDPGQMGLITSTFFFAVAITQIPAGILFDRYGVRVVIATALIAAVSGGLVFAYGHDFWAYALGMALMGFGTSPVFMGSIILVGRWFPPQRFATLSGLMMSVGYLGNLAATRPLAQLAAWIGWRDSMAIATLMLGLSGMLIGLLVREAPRGHAWSQRQPETLLQVVRGVREVLAQPIIAGLFAAAFIGYSTSFAVRGLWIGPYMADVRGLDALTRGDYLFLFAVMGTAGIFLTGYAAGKIGNPRPVVITCALVAASCMLAVALLPQAPLELLIFLLALFSLVANFYPAVLTHGQATFPERLRGRSLTTVNFAVFAGVGITQVVTGYIIDAFPALPDGSHPERAYLWMFGYLAVIGLCGAALYAKIAAYQRISIERK